MLEKSGTRQELGTDELVRQIKWLINIRWIGVSLSLIIVWLLSQIEILSVSPLGYSVIWIEYALNLIYLLISRRRIYLKQIIYFSILIDVMAITIGNYLAGGISDWFAFPAYLTIIMTVGLILSFRESLFAATICIISNSTLIALEYFKILTPCSFEPSRATIYLSGTYVLVSMFIRAVYFFGTAFLAGLVSQIRREKKRALDVERTKLINAIQSFGDGVLITDEKGKITMASPGVQEILGLNPNDLIGKAFFIDATLFQHTLEFPHENPQDLLKEVLKQNASRSSEFKVLLPLEEKFVRYSINPIKNEEDETIGAVVVFNDITKVHRLERIKSDFISTLSHELRTPLTSIKGYTSLLLHPKGRFDGATQKEFLKTIERQSNHLLRMIEDMLDVSRIEAGKLELRKNELNIKPLVEKAVVNLRPKTKLHQFKVSFSKNFPLLYADPDRIEQVITNLIDNAIKYSPEGGLINIKGWEKDGQALLSITDQGIGIAEKDIAGLFEKFQRVDSSLTKTTSGTGLGLFIARSIIELHGGKIWCESEIGKGSTFTFSLPVVKKTV